jgi:hypothetical protein
MKNKHSTKPEAYRARNFQNPIGILRKQYADLLRLRKEVRQLESARNNCDFTSDLKSGRSARGRPSIVV